MKILVDNYSFSAAAKTVTFTDYAGPGIQLDRLLVISNVTDGILIFNFADAGKTGTVAGNVLTLTFDTTAMADADALLIVYDDPAVTAQPVSGPLTDAQLRATPVPVSGTVTASGPLTDAQLRATPVPVSGTVTASGPLTDAQLRATPVPVSGTVTASGPLTDTQLRATAVPVSLASVPSHPVTNAGTFAVQESGNALNAGPVGATTQRVTPGHDAGWLPVRANFTTVQADTTLGPAVAGGTKMVVKKATVTVDNACTADVAVRIGFGASTTPTTTGVILAHPGLAAGSIFPVYFDDGGITGGDGEELRITSEVPTAGSIDIVVEYKII